jgi:multiple sugar transport system permease protein
MARSGVNKPLVGWLFILPALAHLVIFALYPIAVAFFISLFRWQMYKPDQQFVGFGNYASALTEESFRRALWNTLRYAVISVPLGIAVALGVALLVAPQVRAMAIFRTIFYIPAVASGVAVAMLWIYVYLPETGMINASLLALFGENGLLRSLVAQPYKSIDFLNRSEWAMWAVAFMSVWTGLGPRMIIYLAGLLGIPASLYEAAELDGAGPNARFWRITLPMLAPTTFFILVTSTIGAMQVFTPIYMMTRGGPEGSTDVIGYHIYTEAWVTFNTGLASAKSFVLLIILAGISWFQFGLMRRQLQDFSNV